MEDKMSKVLSLNLNSIVKPEQAMDFDYPGFPGFSVKLCYLGRERLNAIRKACISKKVSKEGIQDSMDFEKFNRMYSEAVILGWKGLKMKYVSSMMLVDIPEGVDGDSELEFTIENAEAILKHSTEFDTFVTSTLGDLANFTKHG